MPSYPTGQKKADGWKVTAMAAKRDYYEILGIDKNADDNTIKKAYRKLAKKYHPDQNAGNAQAERQFKEVTEAYSVLSDPEKKKLYDQFGHAAFDGSAPDPDSFTRGGAGNGGFREFQRYFQRYISWKRRCGKRFFLPWLWRRRLYGARC